MPPKINMLNRVQRKVKRVRAKLQGTAERPRISVFRSNKFMYGQAIDDVKRVTLAAAKGTDPKTIGLELATKLKKSKVEKALFDRGRYLYHGRVKTFAESLRENGITI